MIRRRRFLGLVGALGLGAAGGVAFLKRGALRVAARNLFHPRLRVGSTADLAGDFEVCIIGSGPAGAVLGIDLARRGIRTLVLESGPAPGRIGDLRGRLDVFDVRGDTGYPLAGSRFRGVGGTSELWTGRSSRMHPIDFAVNAYSAEGAEWPISYEELQPYYARAERTLRVSGESGSLHRAPRSSPYPLDPKYGVAGTKELIGRADIAMDYSPVSTSALHPGPLRAAVDLLPIFTDLPGALLIPGLTVRRLEASRSGVIGGALAQDAAGTEFRVRAQLFVVACGGLESARLLLASPAPGFTEGIGNDGDLVGRYFVEHPNLTFDARVPDLPAEGLGRGRSHQFYETFKEAGFGSIIVTASTRDRDTLRLGASVEMRPLADNRVTLSDRLSDGFGYPATRLDLRWASDDLATLGRTRDLLVEVAQRLGGREIRELPLSWSHHHMGTCRMGNDPATSVTDRDLRVHRTTNLFVLSSAVFVTGGAAHPTPAIVALAHRLADHLAGRTG